MTLEVEIQSTLQRWWSRLVWESEREFISPYNIDECVRRLKVLNTKHDEERSSFLSTFRFSIKDLEDHGDHFTFRLHMRMSKVILSADLFGQLIDMGETITQVKLRLGYTLGSVITLVLLIPFIFVVATVQSGINTGTLLFAAGFCIFILVMQISFGYGLKPELYQEIHKTLAGDKLPTHTP